MALGEALVPQRRAERESLQRQRGGGGGGELQGQRALEGRGVVEERRGRVDIGGLTQALAQAWVI